MYITDALKVIAENSAVSANKFLDDPVGKVMSRRWAGEDKPDKPEDSRTTEEVTAYMLNKLRGGGED